MTVLCRLVLAGILAATIASNVRLSPSFPFDVRERVASVMKRAGGDQHAGGDANENPLIPMSFDLPGCAGPVQVIPASLNLHESPIFTQAVRPDYVRRFLYLDRQWINGASFELRIAWLREKALSMVGLARFDAEPRALLVAEPEGCGAFERVDWPAVWARRGPVYP